MAQVVSRRLNWLKRYRQPNPRSRDSVSHQDKKAPTCRRYTTAAKLISEQFFGFLWLHYFHAIGKLRVCSSAFFRPFTIPSFNSQNCHLRKVKTPLTMGSETPPAAARQMHLNFFDTACTGSHMTTGMWK